MNILRHIVVPPDIREKLESKHGVNELEVEECFLNHSDGIYLEDDREDNRTDPPTEWFIGETYRGRLLKIVFVYRDGNIFIKTAYEPNENEIRIYNDLRSKP